MNIKKNINKIIAFLLVATCLVSSVKVNVKADSEIRKNFQVIVDGTPVNTIMALEVNYDNDLYVSMRGIAKALNGTNGAFNIDIKDNKIDITKGANYDGDYSLWEDEELGDRSKMTVTRHEITVNGEEKKYYSMIGNIGDGIQDAFVRPVTLALILDENISIDADAINIDTSRSFIISDEDLLETGATQGINSMLIGNSTTGEIYLEHDVDEVVPIASTTKLMTYFVVMDAVSNGDISLDDDAYISDAAVHMSEGIDGVIAMKEGMRVPVRELINGMLLKSSNESAIVLAEHVAGTEEEFVKRMNNKAKELSLENARFYNSNGVPVFEKQLIPAKMQNHMTASDMFKLVSALLKKYPEIINVTSIKSTRLNTLGIDIKTTNNVMYNVDEVKGLKTGTTNKSGACIVTCMPLERDGVTHYITTVIFGTEGEYERSTFAELTARYGIDKFRTSDPNYVSDDEGEIQIPTNPDVVVSKLVDAFMRKQQIN